MTPASRRIVLYGLLLLVPAVLVGGAAIGLLHREQSRLERETTEARAARRDAVAARARLITENLELLMGDVQAGLLDPLAVETDARLDALLDDWEKSHPMVQAGFRCTLDGRLLRPRDAAADDRARGLVRIFGPVLRSGPPWGTAMRKEKAQNGAVAPSVAESDERKVITRNVAQVQSARRDVQELFKSQSAVAAESSLAEPAAPAASGSPAPGTRRSAASSGDSVRPAPMSRARGAAAAPVAQETLMADAVAGNVPAAAVAGRADRRGWLPHVVDGRLHLLAWTLPAGAEEVRGVQLELPALVGRFAATLPAEVPAGEGYALRDHQQRVMHRTGTVGAAAAVSIPLARAIFPGWSVAGYLAPVDYPARGGQGVFWLSSLLVGLFVAAILAGGALLVGHARRQEAEAAQKTSFVANVSHEFKTPLTTIRLYAELLEQGRVKEPGQGAEYLRTIARETQRLARLVNNALDFSRLEQGRKKFAVERLDLTAELVRMLEAQRPRLAECGLRLGFDAPREPRWAGADRDAFEQILLNLLDNACKYAAEGGEVTVTLGGSGAAMVEVRVGDRGPGVPEEHRERVFEKFHRVDAALTVEKTGAGLGLSIARQLARGMNGDLRCRAREGGGAEFVLTLPAG